MLQENLTNEINKKSKISPETPGLKMFDTITIERKCIKFQSDTILQQKKKTYIKLQTTVMSFILSNLFKKTNSVFFTNLMNLINF